MKENKEKVFEYFKKASGDYFLWDLTFLLKDRKRAKQSISKKLLKQRKNKQNAVILH